MTLNDNPRVDAERRYKMLRHRREWLYRIVHRTVWPKGVDWVENDSDYNLILCWSYRARVNRLRFLIESEITQVRRVLKSFGWKE